MEEFLKNIKQDQENISVLDIPVGTGRFFQYYKDLNFSAIGLDISSDMLSEAKNKSEKLNFPITLRGGDVTNIDFPDNSFDLVNSVRIFTLLDKKNFAKALKEVSRISKKYVVLNCYVKIGLQDKSMLRKFYINLRRLISSIIRFAIQDNSPRITENNLKDLLTKNRLKIKTKELIKLSNGCYAFTFYFLEKNNDD